ncbi:SLOG family protein [Pseudomonas denitrificans (nom. rej.)]|nr:SLOG family protein [Pseudomonas denitrificans (nom. rej.)]
MPVRIIVCGSDRYENRDHVRVVLDHVHELRDVRTIILTSSLGVAQFARAWARYARAEIITCSSVSAMFQYQPNGVVAFPGSSHTRATLYAAALAGVSVYVAPPHGVLRDSYCALMPPGGPIR